MAFDAQSYHKPILAEKCIEFLNVRQGGIYVDCTAGGGGHSALILEKLSGKGKLLAFDKDDERILRLFGSSEPVRRSRLQFADAFLSNAKELSNVGVTEVKTENAISRANSVANPRQIERVIAGAKFGVSIVYDVTDPAQVEEDLSLLAKGMKLLQMDYLGGHGSRGSGRVSLKNFALEGYGAQVDLSHLKSLFDEVDSYELFSV